MLQRYRVEQPDQSQCAGAGERRDGHAYEGHEELVEMMGEQTPTQPMAETGTDEGADHVEGAAAEQKHEGCAGAGRGESGERWGIKRLAMFDHVESLVRLAHGDACLVVLGLAYMVEMLCVLAFRRFVMAVLESSVCRILPLCRIGVVGTIFGLFDVA